MKQVVVERFGGPEVLEVRRAETRYPGAGEVLVSGALVDAAGDVEGVDFVAGKPIALKGKKKPFGVFRARRTPARE